MDSARNRLSWVELFQNFAKKLMKQQRADNANEDNRLGFPAGTISCKPRSIDRDKSSFNGSSQLRPGVERELNLSVQVVFRNPFRPAPGVFSGFDKILSVRLSNTDRLQI